MARDITDSEARDALDTIERSRHAVIAEIGIPRWYWWGLAAGWVCLGLAADFANAWVGLVLTFAFGAANAVVAQRAVSGRRRTGQLSVRADVVGRHLPALVLAAVAGLGLVTSVAGWLLWADGAQHPATIASVIVAVVILLGGPHVNAWARRRAARSRSFQ
ncbi:MAG TPA: hypothetical protein VH419_03600 [Nocardioidaceae bacterium]